MGMNGKEYPQDTWRSPFNVDWDRVVTDVQGSTITIDAPISCAIEKKWGGGEVTKYEDPGRIERCGVENLRGMSEFDPDSAPEGVRQHGPPKLRPGGILLGRKPLRRTSSYSTTSSTAGCGIARRCISSTAWWGRRAARNGSPCRTACLASRSRSAQARAGLRSRCAANWLWCSAAIPTRAGTRS